MTLLTAAEFRSQVATALDDFDLQRIIDREEADLINRFGAHGDGASSVTEYVDATGGDLFLGRPFTSIATIDGAAPGTAYTLIGPQGRVVGGSWRGTIAVVYVPRDDRSRRRAALVDLVRLAIQRTALKAENVAGEYSFQAPDWEAERAAVYRRLRFSSI